MMGLRSTSVEFKGSTPSSFECMSLLVDDEGEDAIAEEEAAAAAAAMGCRSTMA